MGNGSHSIRATHPSRRRVTVRGHRLDHAPRAASMLATSPGTKGLTWKYWTRIKSITGWSTCRPSNAKAAGSVSRSMRKRRCNILPANNAPERALRDSLIKHKLSYCTRSGQRLQFTQRIFSTVQTCKMQGRVDFEFIGNAVQSWHDGRRTLSLLPNTSICGTPSGEPHKPSSCYSHPLYR